jgi:hypothetical protein
VIFCGAEQQEEEKNNAILCFSKIENGAAGESSKSLTRVDGGGTTDRLLVQ